MLPGVPTDLTVLPKFCRSCTWSWWVGRLLPKGHVANGTMSLALPFGFEETHPWGPSRVRIRDFIVLYNIPEGQSFVTATEPFNDAGLWCDSFLLLNHRATLNILHAIISWALSLKKMSLCSPLKNGICYQKPQDRCHSCRGLLSILSSQNDLRYYQGQTSQNSILCMSTKKGFSFFLTIC